MKQNTGKEMFEQEYSANGNVNYQQNHSGKQFARTNEYQKTPEILLPHTDKHADAFAIL